MHLNIYKEEVKKGGKYYVDEKCCTHSGTRKTTRTYTVYNYYITPVYMKVLKVYKH